MWGQAKRQQMQASTSAELQQWVNAQQGLLQQCIDRLNYLILDKPEQTRLAIICLLAGGHLLIEDLPGLGKTTLAQSISKIAGLHYQRIQFTNDMLASDIIGVNIFNQQTQQFEFKQGPVFTQILLADEINRSSPKTQSALLQAMEEQQVTLDGQHYDLPKPFWVIATQNPYDQSGTHALPESQLDRFLMRISMGYPSREAERQLLLQDTRQQMVTQLTALLNDCILIELQQKVAEIFVSDAILDYILDLSAQTRLDRQGLSTRGVLALKRAAQAAALLSGRAYVMPEDVQLVFSSVVAHRMGISKERCDALMKTVVLV